MSKLKKIIASALVLGMIIMITPVNTQAATMEELQAQIAALLSQITALQAQLGTATGGTTTSTACFTKLLKVGVKDAEVTMLQEKLAMDSTIYPEGLVTGYFGSLSQAAVQKFQAKNGVVSSGTPETTGYGLVGPATRAKLNALYCVTTPVVPGTTPTPTTPVVVGQGLTVALAYDTPGSGNIISDTTNGGQSFIPMAKFNFTAGSDGAVQVNELKLNRSGISSNNDVRNIYLYDGETQLAEMKSITSDNVATFSNTAGLFTVPAGTTKTITVKMDINENVSAGKTFAFGITSASFVTTNGATVSGTFPMTGNPMTVAAVTDLGTIAFSNATANSAVDPDATTAKDMVRFTLTMGNQKVSLKKLTLTMIGTADAGDFSDVTMAIGATTYGPVQVAADKTITFDMSSNPYVGESGSVKSLLVSGKVIGGAGRKFYLAIQNAKDIVAYDMNYNVYIPHNASDTFSVVKPTADTEINAGSLTVVRAIDAPTGDISLSGTNLEIGRFNFTASGEAIKVTSLTADMTCTNPTTTIKNVKLYVNGSQVGTTDASLLCDTGATTPGITAWGSFGSSFMVNAGETAVVSVRGDLTVTGSLPTTGQTVLVNLNVGTDNYQRMNSGTTGSTPAITGNTLTIRSGAVNVAKNTAIANGSAASPSFVTGENGALVGSFVITAGLGEDVDITSFVLVDTDNAFASTTTNLTLKDSNGVQIGSTYGTLTETEGTTYSFVPSGNIRIAAGQQNIFNVYADAKTGMGAKTIGTLYVDAIYGTGVSTSQAADYLTPNIALQSLYVAAEGSLTIATGANTPIAQKVTSGKTYTFANFKATAGVEEDVRMTQLVVTDTASGSGADAADLSEYRLYDVTSGSETLIAGPVYSVDVTTATTNTGFVTFNGFNYTIAKNTTKDLAVKAKVVSWSDGQSANTHLLKVISDYNTTDGSNPVIAYGAKSNATLTATISTAQGNTMTVYRTQPSVSTNFTASNGASSQRELAHFIVSNETNEGGYAMTVERMKITINGDLTETSTNSRVFTLYKDSIATGNIVGRLTLAGESGDTYGGVLDFATTGSTVTGFTGYTATATTNFTPSTGVEISSGSSKTFILVADTTVPKTTSTATVYVSATLAADGITWSDGSATTITSVNNLPLSIGSYNQSVF